MDVHIYKLSLLELLLWHNRQRIWLKLLSSLQSHGFDPWSIEAHNCIWTHAVIYFLYPISILSYGSNSSPAVPTQPHAQLTMRIWVQPLLSCPQGFAEHTQQLWTSFPTYSSYNLDIGQTHVANIFTETSWPQNTPVLWPVISNVYQSAPGKQKHSHCLFFLLNTSTPCSLISTLGICCRVSQTFEFLI